MDTTLLTIIALSVFALFAVAIAVRRAFVIQELRERVLTLQSDHRRTKDRLTAAHKENIQLERRVDALNRRLAHATPLAPVKKQPKSVQNDDDPVSRSTKVSPAAATAAPSSEPSPTTSIVATALMMDSITAPAAAWQHLPPSDPSPSYCDPSPSSSYDSSPSDSGGSFSGCD